MEQSKKNRRKIFRELKLLITNYERLNAKAKNGPTEKMMDEAEIIDDKIRTLVDSGIDQKKLIAATMNCEPAYNSVEKYLVQAAIEKANNSLKTR